MKLSQLLREKVFAFRTVPIEEQAITKIEENLGMTIEEARAEFIDRINNAEGSDRLSANKIEIDCSGQAAEELIPLLVQLYTMGMQGSSRGIKIEDWEGDDTFGFDGDGSSAIGEIRLNGEKIVGR